MAFDGSVVHAIAQQLHQQLEGGRIAKIAQPEKNELLLTIKREGVTERLLLSADPSLPIAYLTDDNKPSPVQAPAFCMLLRKYISGGRIVSVTQPSMERIIDIRIEHFNELNDQETLILTIEMMGKYSNIILRKEDVILDSIRHISSLVSSVREVLPGRTYFIPFSGEKLDPFLTDEEAFGSRVFAAGNLPLAKALYSNLTGFSPMLSEEVLFRAGLDSDLPASAFQETEKRMVFASFLDVMASIRALSCLNIIYRNEEPEAFGVLPFRTYESPSYSRKEYTDISALLKDFYSQRQRILTLRQKTSGLRQTVTGLLQKNQKKYDLQLRQIKDTEKKEKYRVYGELLTAYGYDVPKGAKSFDTIDFYTSTPVTIPLDPTISAIDNGKKYFQKYAKLRRTQEALSGIITTTEEEIRHLQSILLSLDMVSGPEDIAQIRQELAESGYTGKQSQNGSANNPKKRKDGSRTKSSPLHYVSSDGFDIYVGKNNYQNDELTFRQASASDWWFHAKNIPGSHVVLMSKGAEVPDRTFEEAASLAAYYSASSKSDKVEVQYTQRKNLKKPPSAKPGFVVFHTYFSMSASTGIDGIRQVL